ncbi:hypothetical protein SEA_VANLEE_106 [Gordonia phage VanLee]|uniref:Uncharacterized protein n=1 Tax=Gordonia phage VanLee TaxID=2845816 RepID=A0A8F2IFF0_9CAUD|nr:hypothetical protein QEH49_gp106 [Gordonia phage VanLee]QWS68223.1 hypothetical protein SEA_VANLEE_106 [Gordonia phage VanLee]
MTLDECRESIGAGVVYDPGFPGARKEDGEIVDVGPVYAMVRYGSQVKATPPESLRLLMPSFCTSRWTNPYGRFDCTQPPGHEGDHRDDRYGENVSITWDTVSADRETASADR